jgi:GMP synthase (glutamine-hydrolysing)
MAERVMRRKILIVLHQAHSTPARVGRQLQLMGYELDMRRPSLGEALPQRLDGHAGVVVFGGPMSANDTDEWIRREIDWLAVPLEEAKPYLGICLGAQLLARQLGARVFTHPDRRGEAGYYPLSPTSCADALCEAPFPRYAYQWHYDGFDLPVGAQLLADGLGDFHCQAYRYGPAAVALQFHPEVTYQMMCRWTTRAAERLTRPGTRPPREHLDGWFQHDGAVSTWLARFLAAWAEGALPPIEARPNVGERVVDARPAALVGGGFVPELAAALPSA